MSEDPDPYAVKGNRMNAFAKDSQGYIWIAADDSLNRYEPGDGRLKKFFGKQKNSETPSPIRIAIC